MRMGVRVASTTLTKSGRSNSGIIIGRIWSGFGVGVRVRVRVSEGWD